MNTVIPRRPTALIAEDEPRLAKALGGMLNELWPELDVLAIVNDGEAAIAQALELTPDVIFLDIKMPGQTGLEVAETVADEWPEERPMPLLLFVTAYDEYALQAFERAATDYLLKPVTEERLALSIARLRQRLQDRAPMPASGELAQLVTRVQSLQPEPEAAPEQIKVLRAAVGNTVRMIRVEDVLYLEAAHKYVNVITAGGQALVRLSMRELQARIEGVEFIQVHRSTAVNADCIDSALRDERGGLVLKLRGTDSTVRVSRAFAHLFKPM